MLKIVCFENELELAKCAAGEIASLLREKPEAVLGLATGSTPVETYKELCRMHKEEGLDFSRVTSYNLDEYVGLPAGHSQSYRTFMEERAARLGTPANAPTKMGDAPAAQKAATSSSKEDYQRATQAAADARKKQHRIEKLQAEATALETELEQIEADLAGDAATDYVRAAALDARRTDVETRLMEIYESLESENL